MSDEPHKLTLSRPFADGLLAIHVSGDAQAFPFVAFAQALVAEYGGRVLERLGTVVGDDEVYWDIALGPHTLTLHRQHYLGVFLCAANPEAEDRLRALLPFVRRYCR